MSIFTERTSKKIDTVFVMALLTLFAATALALVLIGAKHYRFVTNAMTGNHEDRTTSSYLIEKVRQQDTANAISVCDLQGTPALSIVSTEDDYTYITYIYYYEGSLRELVVTENSVFSLSGGQTIIPMRAFELTLVGKSLICAEITDTQGQTQVIYLPLHSSIGKEDL